MVALVAPQNAGVMDRMERRNGAKTPLTLLRYPSESMPELILQIKWLFFFFFPQGTLNAHRRTKYLQLLPTSLFSSGAFICTFSSLV